MKTARQTLFATRSNYYSDIVPWQKILFSFAYNDNTRTIESSRSMKILESIINVIWERNQRVLRNFDIFTHALPYQSIYVCVDKDILLHIIKSSNVPFRWDIYNCASFCKVKIFCHYKRWIIFIALEEL